MQVFQCKYSTYAMYLPRSSAHRLSTVRAILNFPKYTQRTGIEILLPPLIQLDRSHVFT